MTPKQFRELHPGSTIRHKHEAHAMVVCACYGDRVTAVRTADVTNPVEWDVLDSLNGEPRSEETSEEIAAIAGRLLHHESPDVRRLAGSVLTQRPDHDPQGFGKLG